MERVWKVAQEMSSEFRTQFPELPPVVSQILWNRGIRTLAEVDVFLGPDWTRDVISPFTFTQMQKAVDRVFLALEAGEMITVHGDYDADGVCGSAVLMSTLLDITRLSTTSTPRLSIFLPHREKDGYGLSVKTVDHLHEHEKTKLIITVDCGVSNTEAIARAKELGTDTIVCDHHQMPETLPVDAILLHPLVLGETYENKKLCGTGVAYKLATALIIEARKRGLAIAEGYEKWLLDLVAIATVTDVMPILGENRVLETFGLRVLNKTRRIGLKELLRIAGLDGKPLDTWSIGFQIGPRINAAGRMDHANAAYELLMCEDTLQAVQLAQALNQSNIDRQRVSDALYQTAKAQIGEVGERRILFAIGDGWSVGLAGLVAGKLMQDYALPVFVICKQEDGKYAGSGRSLHGFDVTAAMKQASSCLARFGGHPQACGMSLVGEENLSTFQRLMEEQASAYFDQHDSTAAIELDQELSPSEVNWDLIEALKKLEPHGEGNPRPLFKSPPLQVMEIGTVGLGGKHLKLTAREMTQPFYQKFIGFRFGEWVQKLSIGAMIEVVFEVGVNEWNGNREIQLRIVDIKTLNSNH